MSVTPVAFLRRFRRAIPYRTARLAYIALRADGTPDAGAWRPFDAFRVIGGRRWSLTIVRLAPVQTKEG